MTFSQRSKILAVDDVPDNLFLLEVILSEMGNYHLSCAESGKAALEFIESTPPDLILLDVMMPGMNGYEVTQRVRRNKDLPYIPIVLLTAHEDLNASEGMDAGADSFIRKPYDIDELLNCMETLLRSEYALCC